MWSDAWPAMDGVVSLLAEVSYNKDLLLPVRRHANVSRPLRKPSVTFRCRDIISFIRLLPSIETDDFMARSKWEISNLADLVGSMIVSVLACEQAPVEDSRMQCLGRTG